MNKPPRPGRSRDERLGDKGLARLEKQLTSGAGISDAVLMQWVRRYGEAARVILRRHGRDLSTEDMATSQKQDQ